MLLSVAVYTQRNQVVQSIVAEFAPGKQKASRNGTEHGLFTNFLPNGESRTEYEKVLSELREDYRPVVAREGLVVQKLAMITCS